jgi:transcriptional regulator with XRE-family HTH domain
MVHLILEQIRKTRIEKNLSQQNLAFHLNITQSSYAKIEKGEIKLSVAALLEISSYLSINPAAFFEQGKKETPEKNAHPTYFNQNNDIAEIKQMILEMKQISTYTPSSRE